MPDNDDWRRKRAEELGLADPTPWLGSPTRARPAGGETEREVRVTRAPLPPPAATTPAATTPSTTASAAPVPAGAIWARVEATASPDVARTAGAARTPAAMYRQSPAALRARLTRWLPLMVALGLLAVTALGWLLRDAVGTSITAERKTIREAAASKVVRRPTIRQTERQPTELASAVPAAGRDPYAEVPTTAVPMADRAASPDMSGAESRDASQPAATEPAAAGQAEDQAALAAARSATLQRERATTLQAERAAMDRTEQAATVRAERAAMAERAATAERASALEAERTAVLDARRAAALETQRTAVLGARRAAALETQRAAALETQRAAALDAKRVAALNVRAAAFDAKRTAALEAEQSAALKAERTAALKAERTAALDARRVAARDAKRVAALDARAAAVEARRTAEVQAQRTAALEARRTAELEAERARSRLAAQAAARLSASKPVVVATLAPQLSPARQRPATPAALPGRDFSPSFNCRRARGRVNLMICDDPALARLDRQLSAGYFAALRNVDPVAASELQQDQVRFLKERATCAGPQCVAALYSDRLDEIDRLAR